MQVNVFLLISTLLPKTVHPEILSHQVLITSKSGVMNFQVSVLPAENDNSFNSKSILGAFYRATYIWSFRIDLSYIVRLFSVENPKPKTWTIFRNVRFLPPAEFQHPGLEEEIEMAQSGQMAAALVRQRSTGKQYQQWKVLHWVEIEQEDHRFGFGTRSGLGVLWCPKAESAAHVSNQVLLPKHLP